MANSNREVPYSNREWEQRNPERPPESAESRETEQPADRKPNMNANDDNANSIKTIKPDADINPSPKAIENKEMNRDPGEPKREDSVESSNTGRFVRLPLNKAPDTCIERLLIIVSYMIAVILFPISLICIFVVVRQFERVVILRNGKVHRNRVYGPGLVHYLPCVDTVNYLDLRIVCYAVPTQEALTKDSLTVAIDAVVYYKITDPISAVINVADFRSSIQFLAATMLRNALGTRKLAELLRDRPAVSMQIYHNMDRVARNWGITVVRVDVKDICLPIQLQRAMAAEAESTRHANAKIIVAKAEIESTKNLQKATNILMDNPHCMQLRYLQSLQMISNHQTHTIVFPFSVGHLGKLFK